MQMYNIHDIIDMLYTCMVSHNNKIISSDMWMVELISSKDIEV